MDTLPFCNILENLDILKNQILQMLILLSLQGGLNLNLQNSVNSVSSYVPGKCKKMKKTISLTLV